jgi:acyl-CoA synthetase (AMP-forming)/AMP-acid ligase II
MADRIADEDLEGINLESIRMLINCSEPVRAESHERFYRRFSKYGLRREALGACYAMAEATFAVTQTAPGAEARQLRVEQDELARGPPLQLHIPHPHDSYRSQFIGFSRCKNHAAAPKNDLTRHSFSRGEIRDSL